MSAQDDMNITLGNRRVSPAYEERPSPLQDRAFFTAACGDASGVARPAYLSEEVLAAIQAHGWSSLDAEVGGLLLGAVAVSSAGEYVRVEQALPARMAAEKRAELTFTHETWAALNEDHKSTWPGLSIVGWYHTHPGMGVFLSNRDKFLHKSFFAQESNIALVIDPLDATRGLFHRVRGQMVPAPGYYVYGAPERRDAIELLARTPSDPLAGQPTSSMRWRRKLRDARRLATALVLGALLALACEHGWAIVTSIQSTVTDIVIRLALHKAGIAGY